MRNGQSVAREGVGWCASSNAAQAIGMGPVFCMPRLPGEIG